MMFHLVVVAALFASCYSVNVIEDCGGADAYIKFHKLDITPMPLDIKGKIQVEADVQTFKRIGRGVSMSVELKKSNLGGSVNWTVPCTNIGLIGDAAEGFDGYLGTCDYKGSCDFPFIKTWTTENSCPDFFQKYDVPCECPFPPKRFTTTERFEVDLGQFKDRIPVWLVEGGYNVKATLTDTTNNKVVGCIKMNFQVKTPPPCSAVLKRLNACPK